VSTSGNLTQQQQEDQQQPQLIDPINSILNLGYVHVQFCCMANSIHLTFMFCVAISCSRASLLFFLDVLFILPG